MVLNYNYALICNYFLCWQVGAMCGMKIVPAHFSFFEFSAWVNFQGQYVDTSYNQLISETLSFPISIQP